jgi:hypothetical protein
MRVHATDWLLKLGVGSEGMRRLGAALWRRLLADPAAGPLPRGRLEALMKFAADPALANDTPTKSLPKQPEPAPLAARSTPVRVVFAERGVLPLEDVRPLPDGGYLLALGESGVALTRPDGKEAMRFPIPAHHLVLAHNGRRALVLGRREKVMRVARVDLVARSASDWFSAGLRHWAGEYDGTTWNVVAEERLMALDTAAQGRSVLWQISDLPGRIIGFDQQQAGQALLLATGSNVEQWRYALPERRLMQRDSFPVAIDTAFVLPDCHGAEPIGLKLHKSDGDALILSVPRCAHGRGAQMALPAHESVQATLHDGLLLLRFDTADGWRCQLVDFNGGVLAEVTLPDAIDADATVRARHLLAWDRSGRLVDIEIDTSLVRTLALG